MAHKKLRVVAQRLKEVLSVSGLWQVASCCYLLVRVWLSVVRLVLWCAAILVLIVLCMMVTLTSLLALMSAAAVEWEMFALEIRVALMIEAGV